MAMGSLNAHTNLGKALRFIHMAENLLGMREFKRAVISAECARNLYPAVFAIQDILVVAQTLHAGEARIVNGQPNWYAVLGVIPSQPGCPLQVLANKYRRLILILNPNRNKSPFADDAFRLVINAWAAFSDPFTRFTYDYVLLHSPVETHPPVQHTHTHTHTHTLSGLDFRLECELQWGAVELPNLAPFLPVFDLSGNDTSGGDGSVPRVFAEYNDVSVSSNFGNTDWQIDGFQENNDVCISNMRSHDNIICPNNLLEMEIPAWTSGDLIDIVPTNCTAGGCMDMNFQNKSDEYLDSTLMNQLAVAYENISSEDALSMELFNNSEKPTQNDCIVDESFFQGVDDEIRSKFNFAI